MTPPPPQAAQLPGLCAAGTGGREQVREEKKRGPAVGAPRSNKPPSHPCTTSLHSRRPAHPAVPGLCPHQLICLHPLPPGLQLPGRCRGCHCRSRPRAAQSAATANAPLNHQAKPSPPTHTQVLLPSPTLSEPLSLRPQEPPASQAAGWLAGAVPSRAQAYQTAGQPPPTLRLSAVASTPGA